MADATDVIERLETTIPAWKKPDLVKDKKDQPIRKDVSVKPKTEAEIMMEEQARSNRIREDLLREQKESA